MAVSSSLSPRGIPFLVIFAIILLQCSHVIEGLVFQELTARPIPKQPLYRTTSQVTVAQSHTVPFIIERVSHTNDRIYSDIAKMCIDVFFNDGNGSKGIPPWKEVQLAYLRALQASDLKRRREKYPKSNAMFVAYRVERATPETWSRQPLILNPESIHNLKNMDEYDDVVRGEILGFVEVTERPYGLGGGDYYSWKPSSTNNYVRPILTNLSVRREARRSGVGSQLLTACERIVTKWNRCDEMVLEVEQNNESALEFYRKRGYELAFANKSCRRYDTSGLVLRKLRCTRMVLCKTVGATATTTTTMTTNNNKAAMRLGNLGSKMKQYYNRVIR